MSASSSRHLRASAMVLYRFKPELEILIVRRSEKLRSFPGAWTFPGGRWDSGDGALDSQSLQEALPDRHTAMRELFEETALLPGFNRDNSDLNALRQALLADKMIWPEFCQAAGYEPPVEQLISLGLRMSPPYTPRRFLTWYFLWDASELNAEIQLSDELVEARWLHPKHILKSWQQGQALIPPPVRGVLNVLAESQDPLKAVAALQALSNSESQMYGDMEIFPGIEMLPLRTPTLPPATHTNCWMIGRERFVIIDPATPEAEEQSLLWRRIQQRLDAGEQPLAILLTHHHHDHIGAVNFLQECLDIPVAAHPWTADKLAPEIQVSQRVDDGFIWDLGPDPDTTEPWLIEAVFTPGHAPGHLCFVDRRHNIAVVGDMLAGYGTILIKRPRGDMAVYLDSLRRLAGMQLKHALPAHGPLILNPTAYCEHYIQHRLKREAKVLEALEQGPLESEALLEAVYADTDRRAWPLARYSLEAHLHKLQNEARVGCSESGQWQLQN